MGFFFDDDTAPDEPRQGRPLNPKTQEQRARRAQMERLLAGKTVAANRNLLHADKLYNVLYADPPWRFEPYNRTTGLPRAADNHYPTMTLDGIKALKVPAAADCVLFLWATVPMLPQALEVMTAWGFTYKSQFVWVKPQIGTGFWNRNQHELLLIGTRGTIPAPAPGTQFSSVISAPRGAHSEKPESAAAMIDTLFPNVPKLELFARTTRPGWRGWGNESDEAARR